MIALLMYQNLKLCQHQREKYNFLLIGCYTNNKYDYEYAQEKSNYKY